MTKTRDELYEESRSRLEKMYPIFLMLISLPLSMFFWVGNLAFTHLWADQYDEVPPTRWFAATLIPLLVATWGLKKKSLCMSGAVLGAIVGFILTLGSYLFFVCLLTFFVTSSRVTKFRSSMKNKLENDFKEGGQRNWLQVLCNGGMAAQLGLLYIIDNGCGEQSIDFDQNYRSSWLSVGILAAFACSNGDTWASELGTVIGSSQPFLITSWKRVPKGTNGGVSFFGLLFSLLGGLLVGIVYYLTLLYIVDPIILVRSPPQWPVIFWGGFAGLFGSLFDSFLGATLQYSGVNKKTGVVVEHPGPGIKWISGHPLLDNHCVNLLSTIVTALVTPKLANLFWP
ncbi:transmembrane protein 19 isoform X1 [Lycorma delicatula]|uniref:transmembrane protein 19 isoform X1 n=1 Tax=Lycorma delicatula TaxID=130591 RepID=UPI003F516539